MSARIFDAQVVLSPKNSERGKLLSQYVRARVVSMEGIDVGHWTFDRHTSLIYFITNADEHIYMRYGGRDSEAAETYLDLESLKLALKEGLNQHDLYQQGKLPTQPRGEPFYPADIPDLKKYVLGQRSCVECHHIADYQAQQQEQLGELDKVRTMFPFPDIRTIGIHLDVPKGLVVEKATDQAADAGLQSGDKIVAINGKTVFTFGDLQFQYDKIPRDAKRLSLEIERGQQRAKVDIGLPKLWWYYDVGFRFWSIDPLMYFDAEPLSAERKQALGLPENSMACEVTEIDSIGTSFGFHKLQPGDVITAVNGVEQDETAPDAMLYLRLNLTPGDRAKLSVLRGDEQLEMELTTKRQFYRKSLPETN